jgi:hypothetical protein
MNKQDQNIFDEAKTRFKACESWEAEARENFIFDMRFANGDSQNRFQWPDQIANDRSGRGAPCLTINKTFQHCQMLINDQRQNQSQIEVRPTGNGASFEAAKVFEGICRHIEINSNAQAAYTNATSSQILAGVGYWRVTTDYAHDDSFDQEIYITRVADPLSIYIDPNIQTSDGSDAKYAFCFKDMTREEFDASYPSEEDEVGNTAPLGEGNSSTFYSHDSKDKVRVVEYYRRKNNKDKLHHLDNGMTVRESDVKGADLLDQLKVNSVNVRDIETPEIEWFLIAGSKVIDKKKWLGKYIPIVRLPGLETVIDGRMDRRGQTRQLIDPQRIYNYWSSSAVEFVALQSKTPYLTPVEAISGFETNWANANTVNAAYLPYNGLTEAGQPIPAPARAPPPMMSQAYMSGMQVAQQEMMMATSQYEANMGQKSNEVSGTAVDARQRQGETASYHFIDRFSQAIRLTGRILVDLIPKMYDSERILTILGADGSQSAVHVHPGHQDGQGNPLSHTQVQDPDAEDYDPSAISAIFNPTVGNYAVEADVGPAYSTRRQETFQAISKILQSDMALMPVIGDLMFQAADFPMASQIAERLHRMVPKQALGTAPDPQIGQLQQMLAQQHQEMTAMQGQLQAAKNKADTTEQQKDIDQYRAETDRMKAVGGIDPAAMMPIIRQMVSQVLGQPVNSLIAAHAEENAVMAQPPAAPPSPVLPPQPPSESPQ